jgi:CRP-like cAMP-binding protein
MLEKDSYFFLNKVINSYSDISTETWNHFKNISNYIEIKKNDYICRINEVQNSFFFVNQGLLRASAINEKGVQYNKTFFIEGMFPGSMVALLTNGLSELEIQALEDCQLIQIDFKKYRDLLKRSEDLKLFQISYLEQNWLIKMESKDISFVQKDAQERYEDFVKDFPDLESRLTQYHIASHLGITPTQLSRIRKKINLCK